MTTTSSHNELISRSSTIHCEWRLVGGFNWSPQHLDLEVCDGASSAERGSGGSVGAQITRPTVSEEGYGARVLQQPRSVRTTLWAM